MEHNATSPRRTCAWDVRPGTFNNLSDTQQKKLSEVEKILADDPLPHCQAHDVEDRVRMLLRFLRACEWIVNDAAALAHSHARFWLDFGMADFHPEEEYDQSGVIYRCGTDKFGHAVMVARPCAHHPGRGGEASLRAVRRTVYSVARCCESFPQFTDSMVILYDCIGISMSNWDLDYSRRIAKIFQEYFPERVACLFVINNSWAIQGLWNMVSALLHPETKKKFFMCGTEFEDALCGDGGWFTSEHPYVKYALDVKQRGGAKKAADLPLPKRSPFDTCMPKFLSTSSTSLPHGPASAVLDPNVAATDGSTTDGSLPSVAATDGSTYDSISSKLSNFLHGTSGELMFCISDADRPDMPISFASSGFLGCTGYTANEVTDRNCRFLNGLHTAPSVQAFIRQTLTEIMWDPKHGGGLKATLLNYRKDGTPFWNELHIASICEPVYVPCDSKEVEIAGQWEWHVRKFIGVQVDVTERLRSARSRLETLPEAWIGQRQEWERSRAMGRSLGLEPPVDTWDVDPECTYFDAGLRPTLPSFAFTTVRRQREQCEAFPPKSDLDPAQIIAHAIEVCLAEEALRRKGTISVEEEEWALALQSRFDEMSISALAGADEQLEADDDIKPFKPEFDDITEAVWAPAEDTDAIIVESRTASCGCQLSFLKCCQ